MVDFKKALSKIHYDSVRKNHPTVFAEIVAFSSTFGGPAELDISVRAEVERYCMGLVHNLTRRTET